MAVFLCSLEFRFNSFLAFFRLQKERWFSGWFGGVLRGLDILFRDRITYYEASSLEAFPSLHQCDHSTGIWSDLKAIGCSWDLIMHSAGLLNYKLFPWTMKVSQIIIGQWQRWWAGEWSTNCATHSGTLKTLLFGFSPPISLPFFAPQTNPPTSLPARQKHWIDLENRPKSLFQEKFCWWRLLYFWCVWI